MGGFKPLKYGWFIIAVLTLPVSTTRPRRLNQIFTARPCPRPQEGGYPTVVWTLMVLHVPWIREMAQLAVGDDIFTHSWYPLVNYHNFRKSPFLMGKSTINGPFSIARLNYQRDPEGTIVNGLVEGRILTGNHRFSHSIWRFFWRFSLKGIR